MRIFSWLFLFGYVKKDNCIYDTSTNNFAIDTSIELNNDTKLYRCLGGNVYTDTMGRRKYKTKR